MRIDKFISECGIASRKEAALAAKRGQLLVDGVAERDVSRHIDPEKQSVTYMGRIINYSRFVYVMLNKPEGYVSATEDSRLPVVTELLSDELKKRELFPVGRLDRDTVGLMILTNNGQLAHTVLSPKRHVEKEYRFECAEPLDENAEQTFSEGVTLADGYECKSAGLVCDPDRRGGVITLTEGKYHQIKRMIASFGNKVTYLERISFASIPLDASLARGEWRYLTTKR
ncbi:MAG: 16S rRNA pseudouridine(516) synthase, partial [Ruminococcaceae bacterium]|nr:16S rRNA pseudouridine(516) synthase [Oscillospiraceae bacterium]